MKYFLNFNMPHLINETNKYILLNGKAEEVLKTIDDNTVHCVVTSPPYWKLRDYFNDDQLGHEDTPEEYIENLVKIMREVKRVLRKDGSVWFNIGDSYNNNSGFCRSTKGWERKGRDKGSADKKAFKHSFIKKGDLIGIPWSVVFALRSDGWYLRCDVIYSKNNPMPDGAKNRPTRSHEYIFLLTKSPKYFFDYFAFLEDTKEQPETIQGFGANDQKGTFRMDQSRTFEHYGKRNRRSVWTTSVASFKGEHFATFSLKLIEPCIIGSTSPEGVCVNCGTPWQRVTEKTKVKADNDKGYNLQLFSKGWKKSCKCETNETKNFIVLDPFSGMATTGITALKYRQNYVGIELNKKYLDLSRKRIEKSQGDDIFLEEVKNIKEL